MGSQTKKILLFTTVLLILSLSGGRLITRAAGQTITTGTSDLLVGINGKPASEFTLPQINEMLKQESEFVLRLKRNDGLIEVKSRPRRLI